MLYLFKQALQVDTFCLPKVDLSHGSRSFTIGDLLRAVFA